MYTTRVPRPRGHRPRHSVENQWDLAAALLPDLGAPARGDATRSRCVEDAAAAGQVEAPASPPRHRARTRTWSSSTSAPATSSGGGRSRRLPTSPRLWCPGGRIVVSSSRPGPAQAARAEEVRRLALDRGADGRARSRWPATSVWASSAAWSRGRGCSSEATAGRRTSPPRRQRRWWSSTGRRPRWCGGRGGTAAGPTETVDVGELPCRPCDQRVCEPGDFRCLRGVTPDTVTAAAVRAMAPGLETGAGPV